MSVKKLPLLLLSSFLVSFNAQAQPSPAIEFLMKQPLSVFDFALYRLTEDMNAWVSHRRFDMPHNSKIRYVTTYDLAENDINLNFNIRMPHSYLYEITIKEKACSRVVTSIRRYFHTMAPSKGARKPSRQEREAGGIYRYFSRSGVSESGRPASSMDEIEKASMIRVTLVPGKQLDDAFRCRGSLLGEEIDYL